MKIARFTNGGSTPRYGIVQDSELNVISGDIFGSFTKTGEILPLDRIRLLAPVEPPNILCFGRNYKAHAEEGGDDIPKFPILFIKATSCLANPDDEIIIPAIAPGQIDYEAELAVVIGKRAYKVPENKALDYVLGYTCANDVSSRDCQNADGQWARAKSFDTFCPLGPWIETDLDPASVRVQGRLNGRTMQDASTALLIFSISFLISYLSRAMTLLPGTVILTGTPAGCGFARKPPLWLKPGDVYGVEIEGIGVLRNAVK
ncbi:MAG: fumarylacetoacetate hydrolase family protein [Victivallales bacterium]|nr:fumarylacetoacetate hydrolase family protein [Victivallales bacterium]